MSGKEKQEQVVDLSKLTLQYLAHLKKQYEQEISVLQDSLQTLKVAQAKFSDSRDCLDSIGPESKDQSIMVPLTGSMYVPGKIADSEKVLIDIGTGYYIHVDTDSAKDYFKRKVAFVTEQMEKIQAIGIEKSKTRDAIVEIMEAKIQSQLAAQMAVQNATAKT